MTSSPAEAPHLSPTTYERAKFSVVGSGVIGLLVARELASQGHDVTVYSTEGKPGDHAQHGASPNAAGQFLPWVPEAHSEALLGNLDLAEVTDVSRKFYEELAQNPHETGVMPVHNVELVRSEDMSWPPTLVDAMGAKPKRLDTPVMHIEPFNTTSASDQETPYDTVLEFDTFSINTRRTVKYLADHAETLGVKFEQRQLSRDELDELDGIIINAAGMGAKGLNEPGEIVKEFKGHTFVLQPTPGQQVPTEALSVDDLIMMPREDGTVVCGALYLEDPERPIPEEDEANELLERLSNTFKQAAPLVEGLDPDFLARAEILLHTAAYRVETSAGGVRVAPDEEHAKLLHAYGFGGIGWSLGPHIARQIAEQAHQMHQQHFGG